MNIFFRPFLSKWSWRVPFKTFSGNSSCYYEVLGVKPTASNTEIKEAFVNLSKKYHPDVTKSQDGHNMFVQINEAYSVLSRASSRQEYDLRNIARRPDLPFRPRSPDPSQRDNMHEQWYRIVYSRRRAWQPEDDFGPPTSHSNDTMRKAVLIISAFLGLSFLFQAYMLSRSKNRHQRKFVDERQRWIDEFEPMMKRAKQKEDANKATKIMSEKEEASAHEEGKKDDENRNDVKKE